MTLLITSGLVVGIVLSAFLLIYWSVVAWHLRRTVLEIPTAPRGLEYSGDADERDSGGAPARVCVIIPAHNEQAVIGIVAASLRRQDYADFRVVFCLDRCTDGTLTRLKETVGDDPRFEVLEVTQCPPDWAGKVNAIWRGVRDSMAARDAQFLLFADADTEFAPECIRACVGLLRHRKLDMLSLLSTLTTRRWFERLVQPAASMDLMRQYPIRRANAVHRRRAFANGQFILFRRDAYEQVGGHEAVSDVLLEDIELARRVASKGLRAGLFLADRMLSCRMYPDWPAFRRGWKRIYAESANRRSRRLRTSALRLRVVGAVVPLVVIVSLAASFWAREHSPALAAATQILGTSALAVWLAVLAWAYRLGHSPLWSVPLYPLGAWMTGSILREAASDLDRGRPTVWAGREYHRKAR